MSKPIFLVLCIIVLILSMEVAQARSVDSLSNTDEQSQYQRRAYDLKKLRHFLLTSNAEQRTAKREQENRLKQNLVSGYKCYYKTIYLICFSFLDS